MFCGLKKGYRYTTIVVLYHGCFDNVLLLKNTTLDVYAEINMHMFDGQYPMFVGLREICSPFWMVNHLKSPFLMTKSLLVSCQIPFFDM